MGWLLGEWSFDADVDLDIVADDALAIRDAEVAAVELRRGFPGRECFAVHALPESEEGDLKDDFLGRFLDGEITSDGKGVFAGGLPVFALERDLGKTRGEEEIFVLQVCVALRLVGMNRGNGDGRMDGVVGRCLTVDGDRAFKLGEATRDFGEEVAYREADGGVSRIDGVGFAGGAGRRHGKQGERDDEKDA